MGVRYYRKRTNLCSKTSNSIIQTTIINRTPQKEIKTRRKTGPSFLQEIQINTNAGLEPTETVPKTAIVHTNHLRN